MILTFYSNFNLMLMGSYRCEVVSIFDGDKCRRRKDWILVTKSSVNNQLNLFSYPVVSIIINRSYEEKTSICHIKTSKNRFKCAHLDRFDWWTSNPRLNELKKSDFLSEVDEFKSV